MLRGRSVTQKPPEPSARHASLKCTPNVYTQATRSAGRSSTLEFSLVTARPTPSTPRSTTPQTAHPDTPDSRTGTGNSSQSRRGAPGSPARERRNRREGLAAGVGSRSRLYAAPRRNAGLLRGQIGLSRGRGSRIGAAFAWFRPEDGSCGGGREEGGVGGGRFLIFLLAEGLESSAFFSPRFLVFCNCSLRCLISVSRTQA